MKRHVGVTNIEGLRERCSIDEITGCWVWKWGFAGTAKYPVPTVHLGAGVAGVNVMCAVPAYRAAWMLMGREIPHGHVVYRAICGNPLCCNPGHLKCGPRAEMYGHYASTGRNKGQPHRRVANEKNRRKMMLTPERVQQVEAMLAAGKLQKDIISELRMCGDTVRRIRLGKHPHCASATQPIRVIRGASIFTMGDA